MFQTGLRLKTWITSTIRIPVLTINSVRLYKNFKKQQDSKSRALKYFTGKMQTMGSFHQEAQVTFICMRVRFGQECTLCWRKNMSGDVILVFLYLVVWRQTNMLEVDSVPSMGLKSVILTLTITKSGSKPVIWRPMLKRVPKLQQSMYSIY